MSMNTIPTAWSVEERDFPYGGNPQCRYEFLLHYAVLAPSSHNSQPWLFEVTHDGVDLYADPTRALPVVDPENRELIISCGAALELLCVSARFFGYVPHVSDDNPSRNPDFLGRFSFGERRQPDSIEVAMFKAIPHRHTNRGKFKTTQVPDDIIEQIELLANCHDVEFQVLTDSNRRDIARIVSEGDRIQAADPRFRRELAAWVHSNRSHSSDGMPGYAHGIGDLPSMVGPLVVRTFDWGKGQAARDEQLVMGSPLLVALKTSDDKQANWLNTGRALSKVLLMLTHYGLSASFLNQPIEVADLRPALTQNLGGEGNPQILLRIGYGPETKPTPRRPVDQIILKQDS
jgi:hypothetical protein